MTCLLFVIIRSVNYRPPLCEAVFFLPFACDIHTTCRKLMTFGVFIYR